MDDSLNGLAHQTLLGLCLRGFRLMVIGYFVKSPDKRKTTVLRIWTVCVTISELETINKTNRECTTEIKDKLLML